MSATAKSLSTRPSPALSAARPLSASSAARTPAAAGRVDWGHYARVGLGTVVAAVLANALFYYVAAALIAYDPEFVVLASVMGAVIFTVVPAIVAVLLYAALLRFTRHPVGIFNGISAVVFVVTLIPDFTYIPTVPGASPAQTAVLVLMHVIAAVVIVRMLTSVTRSPAR